MSSAATVRQAKAAPDAAVVADTQIRCLLGEPAPSAARLRAQAESAVDRFLALTSP